MASITGADYDNKGFYQALFVWIEKPHVVNKRLCGSKTLCHFHTTVKFSIKDIAENQQDIMITKFTEEEVNTELNRKCIKKQKVDQGCNKLEIIIRDLLPKLTQQFQTVRELIIIDKVGHEAVFLPIWYSAAGGCEAADEISYHIEYSDPNVVKLTLSNTEQCDQKRLHSCSADWITHTLISRLKSWSKEKCLNTSPTTLRLVSVEKYNRLYQTLKEKYGRQLVKMWPECTDPQKFVYEDVGIATYLMLLWEDEREAKGTEKKQSFVDLGCGNGLLVYLLEREGYPGCGVDLQKRKIWNEYQPAVTLKEMAISPSESSLFPDADWLIGNHSDELTPWIPVIAARSSYKCNFFVLPCCSYDFDAKFSPQGKVTSHYHAYIEYISKISTECGFKVHQDSLRIPSTKKVCLVGRERTYTVPEEGKIDNQRTLFIRNRCKIVPKTINYKSHNIDTDDNASSNCTSASSSSISAVSWAPNFQSRPTDEKPKNGVMLHSDLKLFILKTVFNNLLERNCEGKVLSELNDAEGKNERYDVSHGVEEEETADVVGGPVWNVGGRLGLNEVASLFETETLQQLKNECGGLQTILRNSCQAFMVCGGFVQIRDPRNEAHKKPMLKAARKKKHKPNDKQTSRYKKKLCFFYENHPQNCPLEIQDCQFAHGQDDICTDNVQQSKRAKLSEHS